MSQTSKAKRFAGVTAIHVVIVAAFLALLYGAYQASRKHNGIPATPFAQTLSNGTHRFAPTTILISLDGFRADFLHRNLTPTLSSLIRQGVSPKYMLPSFPSLTFPNHFTLVTGLYPESHGVIGNNFWDPITQKEFNYVDSARSMQPEWWNAEPLWLTAELQGVRSGIHMWPGSEAHIGSMEPAYVDEFDQDEKLEHKVSRIFEWLDLPGPDDQPRPQFIAAYVPNVDSDGHKYGPNSTYIRSTIREVDGMLGQIFAGIDDRNLTNVVNIVIVSDHGMATTSTSRLIQLEDIVDTSLIEHTDGWPLYALRPYDTSKSHIQKMYSDLVAKSQMSKYQGTFDVYLRDKDMPKRYHFQNNPRIAPIWIVPKVGWAIVTKDEYDVAEMRAEGTTYHPKGLHGYDHESPLMRAIFVARGPAFPHPEGSQIDVFQNIELYNILCDSLGIEPKANNGTLRLPLKPKGKHNFDEQPETVHDFSDQEDLPPEVPNLNNRPGVALEPAAPSAPKQPQEPTRPEEPEQPAAPTRPIIHDGLQQEDEAPKDVNLWWEWMKGKLDAIKWWAHERLGGHGPKNATETLP